MNIEELLLRAVTSSPTFPAHAVKEPRRFTGCDTFTVTAEGIENRKILLAKNPDESDRQRLESFIAGLSPFVGKVAIGGCLWTATHRYWVFADTEGERLLHWEAYPRDTTDDDSATQSQDSTRLFETSSSSRSASKNSEP
jgi:hypothetical protein